MSKKHKNSKKISNQAALAASILSGDSEFDTLIPTAEGAAKLKKPVRKIHPKLMGKGAMAVDAVMYDPELMSKLLDDAETLVKDGKYTKAMNLPDRQKVIVDFMTYFSNDTVSIDIENGEKLYGMCRKLLSIGKSFYEYDEGNQEFIDDGTYDGLLAKYLRSGKPEPVGIIPKGKKNLKKVSITYPTLHNNMDKAYILREGDVIPQGVKEADSIQEFLIRVYKAIAASPDTELVMDLSPKIDGVSVNGTIDSDLCLTNPQTRGDHNESVAVIGMNNLQIATGVTVKKPFGAQFEAFVTDEDRIGASDYLNLDHPYVSGRHAASGIIHRLCTMSDDELLRFISLYPIETAELAGSYEERQEFLSNFKIVPSDMIPRRKVKGNLDQLLVEISKYYQELTDARESLSFPIDGMVITVVDDDYQSLIGRQDRTNKWQIAYKFNPSSADATVSGITLDNGLKGFRTIQVKLEHPVFIDGVRYDHVPVTTLPAYEKLDLRVGSKVTIGRTGDVIPSITVTNSGTGRKLNAPSTCPSCGNRLIVRNQKLYCDNSQCNGNVIGKFVGFFNRMGLTGYSDDFASMLHDTMKCNDLADVLTLTDEDFERNGVTSALAIGFGDKIRDAVSKRRDYEILGAMNLPGIGPEKAKKFLKHCDLFNRYGYYLSRSTAGWFELHSAITDVVGVNHTVSVLNVLETDTFSKEIHAIAPLVKRITTNFDNAIRVGHTGIKLSDATVALCDRLGYDITDGQAFDILITGSMSSESAKMTKAKKNRLPIFLEDDFLTVYSSKVG